MTETCRPLICGSMVIDGPNKNGIIGGRSRFSDAFDVSDANNLLGFSIMLERAVGGDTHLLDTPRINMPMLFERCSAFALLNVS